MPITTDYSIEAVSATFDGQQIVGNGLWEGDDAIMVKLDGDIGTGLTGADGSGAWSDHAGRPAKITVKIMAGSAFHRIFTEVERAQKAGNRKSRAFTFNDARINEGGQCDRCRVMSVPGIQAGQAQTVREWTLWAYNWIPNVPTGTGV